MSWNTHSHCSLACFTRSNNLCFAASGSSEADMIANPLKSSLRGQNRDRKTVRGFSWVSTTHFPHLQFSFWFFFRDKISLGSLKNEDFQFLQPMNSKYLSELKISSPFCFVNMCSAADVDGQNIVFPWDLSSFLAVKTSFFCDLFTRRNMSVFCPFLKNTTKENFVFF